MGQRSLKIQTRGLGFPRITRRSIASPVLKLGNSPSTHRTLPSRPELRVHPRSHALVRRRQDVVSASRITHHRPPTRSVPSRIRRPNRSTWQSSGRHLVRSRHGSVRRRPHGIRPLRRRRQNLEIRPKPCRRWTQRRPRLPRAERRSPRQIPPRLARLPNRRSWTPIRILR